jgi:O-antigen ligase
MRAVRWLLLATVFVPLVVFPGFFFPFVTTRAVYFRVLVELAIALLLYIALRYELRVSLRRDFVFWALLFWILANTLAAVFGYALIRSLFGDHERMGGVWFWIHLLAYYVALRAALRPEDWWRFFRVAIGVAVIVAGYGLIQHWFRPFESGVGGVGEGSTIGNPGLLAIYLLANLAFCGLLGARSRPPSRLAYGAIVLLLAVAMTFSGNRSSTLALLIGIGAAILSHALLSGAFRRRGVFIAAAILASAVALPFVTRMGAIRPLASSIPALNRLSGGVDSTRVIQWHAAVDGIRARPLLGVGPENYQIIWSRYQHPEMYRFMSDSRWDRPHNAYLEAFATAGILGFLSLMMLCVATGWTAVEWSRRTGSPTGEGRVSERVPASIALGFFLAYVFYLFFWFFDLNSTMLWIALAAFVTNGATVDPLVEIGRRRAKRWQTAMVLAFGAAGLVSVLYVHGFSTLRMARTLISAGNPSLPMHRTLAAFESVFASPAPVTQHALLMYAGRLRDLYPSFPLIRGDPKRAAVFDRSFSLAVSEFERQARQDPLNERLLVQEARVLILGAYYYGDSRLYEAAVSRLKRAVELSPRRVNTHLVLGVAYLNTRRSREALGVFQTAYAVYPPHGQTHSYIAEAYSALDRPDSAALWLRSAVSLGYIPDRDFVQRVADELAAAGNARAAADLTWEYVRGRAGPAFLWSTGIAQPDPVNAELATTAAEFFAAAGDKGREAVVRAAAPGLCVRLLPLQAMAATAIGPEIDSATCEEPWRAASVF